MTELEFVQDAISTGNLWALGEYGWDVEETQVDQSIVDEVRAILTMWGEIQYSYEHMKDAEKRMVGEHKWWDDGKFPGFSNNYHIEQYRILSLILYLGTFSHVKMRGIDDAKKFKIMDRYRLMLERYKVVKSEARLSANQVIDLLDLLPRL